MTRTPMADQQILMLRWQGRRSPKKVRMHLSSRKSWSRLTVVKATPLDVHGAKHQISLIGCSAESNVLCAWGCGSAEEVCASVTCMQMTD